MFIEMMSIYDVNEFLLYEKCNKILVECKDFLIKK